MATALNAVGDRWALLVVRDLILGPRRFTELQHGLQGVGTDILTARLRSLEASGVLARHGQGRARRYALTASGRALRPVLAELARWGAERLELPTNPDAVLPRVALTSLLLDPPPLPVVSTGEYEIRANHESARFDVHGGELTFDPPGEGSTRIDLTETGLRALLIGASVEALHASGEISIQGDLHPATVLLDALTGPRLLEGLRRHHHARSRPGPERETRHARKPRSTRNQIRSNRRARS
ncbi:MAG: winged helix-turn-helix transcriptional regulator [Steroidobacteraceae bacterium]